MPSDIVPSNSEIWPSSTYVEASQKLRVTVLGNDIFRYPLRQMQLHEDFVNNGRHTVHMGGAFDSYLVLPVVETLVMPAESVGGCFGISSLELI
ncbi:hypothetical protein SEUCBS140593_006678 [Sporothrix eucalyptigena]|uniref:Uncharacterized protein n=1 Tax=Sporothrix eucalyptigena TaxID=1812306 RepID=A0ABP0C6V4_9PEZI